MQSTVYRLGLFLLCYYNSVKEQKANDGKKKTVNVRKLVTLAFFSALSLVSFIIEAVLPPLFIPGAKIGLANIFTLLALIAYGPIEAFSVFLIRALLGSFITGNVGALVYSLTAGAISLGVEVLLVMLFVPKISVTAVSVACGVIHNLAQNALFVLFNGATEMLVYFPYLGLIGAVSGAFVGLVVYLLTKHLPEKLFSLK